MQKVIEQARQSLHVGERTFKPTPNLRNPAMLAEAEDFAVYMTGFKTALKRYQGALHVFLKGLPVVARVNLPRVWERVEGGLCEPLRPNVSHAHPTRVGGEYDEGLLRDALDLMDAQLGHDVLRPIDRWLESLAVVRTRMRKLEGLRLDVDARRRRVHRRYMRVLSRMERRSAGGGGGGGGMAGGGGGAVQSTYREQEQLVWEHLSGLVRDAAWLKAFVAGALVSVKEALQASALALGPCKLPLPAFPRFTLGAEYGAIGDPAPLIGDVPDVVKAAAGGAGPSGGVTTPLALLGAAAAGGTAQAGRDVAAALRPKRITAQPLQPFPRSPPAGAGGATTSGGGGMAGAFKELAHSMAAAAKAGPVMTSSAPGVAV
ncbi:hypothetical protein GPECTOR_14g68 [Gonium pectorale]|uniref:Uncharacterized protein n=1 Tax=Gonium pectorale TaxID=33097 RepID=A0A150GMQ9_GONPE|nr:hypothetical protein GPECTOR_14g68 [Gonium pectorale]|eukprot:KXZ51084.1 hypothetical protein GPECTOR_14g68 [Gonium pectorale]